jgi:hypothetical protein
MVVRAHVPVGADGGIESGLALAPPALITDGAGVIVVAGKGIWYVYAPAFLGRHAGVVGAGIPVVTIHPVGTGPAAATLAEIADGADVFVVAGIGVEFVEATQHGIARIVRARIAVGAEDRNTLATPLYALREFCAEITVVAKSLDRVVHAFAFKAVSTGTRVAVGAGQELANALAAAAAIIDRAGDSVVARLRVIGQKSIVEQGCHAGMTRNLGVGFPVAVAASVHQAPARLDFLGAVVEIDAGPLGALHAIITCLDVGTGADQVIVAEIVDCAGVEIIASLACNARHPRNIFVAVVATLDVLGILSVHRGPVVADRVLAGVTGFAITLGIGYPAVLAMQVGK